MSDFYVEIPGDDNSAYNSSDNVYDSSGSVYESFGEVEEIENENADTNMQDTGVSANSFGGYSGQQSVKDSVQEQNVARKKQVQQTRTDDAKKKERISSQNALQNNKTSHPRIKVVPKRKMWVHRAKKEFDWKSYLLGVLSGIIIYWGYTKFRKSR